MKKILNNSKKLNYLLLAIICICWGFADILAKKGLVYFSPYEVGVLRVFVSSILFTPIAFYNIGKLEKKKIHFYILLSLLGTVFPVFLYAQSQKNLDSWITTLASSVTPIFSLFLTKIFLKTKIMKREILGTILSLIGCFIFTLVLVKKSSSNSIYIIFPVVASFCYAASSIILIKYIKTNDVVAVSSFGVSFYLIISFFIVFFKTDIQYKLVNIKDAYIGLYNIILVSFSSTTIAFVCYNLLSKRVSPIFASVSKLIAPIISISTGIVFGEIINFFQFVGIFIIILSIYFIIFSKK